MTATIDERMNETNELATVAWAEKKLSKNNLLVVLMPENMQ